MFGYQANLVPRTDSNTPITTKWQVQPEVAEISTGSGQAGEAVGCLTLESKYRIFKPALEGD